MLALLDRLLRGEAKSTLVQLFRYILVGGSAFLIDFGTMFLLWKVVGMHYLVAAALAFLLGLATNYAISVVWVFDQRSFTSPWLEFTIFGLLGIIGLGITELTLCLLTGLLGYQAMVSKLVATGITFLWNFVARKLILFTSPRPEPKPLPLGDT